MLKSSCSLFWSPLVALMFVFLSLLDLFKLCHHKRRCNHAGMRSGRHFSHRVNEFWENAPDDLAADSLTFNEILLPPLKKPPHTLINNTVFVCFSPVCPMGGGATRLYSALAQTLSSSSPLPLPPSYLEPQQPADTILDPDLCQVNPSLPVTAPHISMWSLYELLVVCRRGPLHVLPILPSCSGSATRPSGTDHVASRESSFTSVMEIAAPSGWCSGIFWPKVNFFMISDVCPVNSLTHTRANRATASESGNADVSKAGT